MAGLSDNRSDRPKAFPSCSFCFEVLLPSISLIRALLRHCSYHKMSVCYEGTTWPYKKTDFCSASTAATRLNSTHEFRRSRSSAREYCASSDIICNRYCKTDCDPGDLRDCAALHGDIAPGLEPWCRALSLPTFSLSNRVRTSSMLISGMSGRAGCCGFEPNAQRFGCRDLERKNPEPHYSLPSTGALAQTLPKELRDRSIRRPPQCSVPRFALQVIDGYEERT